jgi:hypothetical protein
MASSANHTVQPAVVSGGAATDLPLCNRKSELGVPSVSWGGKIRPADECRLWAPMATSTRGPITIHGTVAVAIEKRVRADHNS